MRTIIRPAAGTVGITKHIGWHTRFDTRSYSFIDSLWASLDARYSFRGSTLVNGMNQNNVQQNFSLGSVMNVSLNPRNSLVFEFDKSLVHRNGPALSGFALKYNYSWGKGY